MTRLRIEPIEYYDNIINNFINNRYKNKTYIGDKNLNITIIPKHIYEDVKLFVLKKGYKSKQSFIFSCLWLINDVLKLLYI